MVSEGCFPRIQHIGMGSRRRAPLSEGFSWLRQKLFLFFFGTQGRAERECPAAERTLSREELNQRAEKLLRSHGDSALRLAYSYLHNMSDAEEVLQDTLIQFLKTAPRFENEKHERAWMLRVAGNLSKNRIQYNKTRDADELSETLAATESEDLSFVWEAVKALPSNYREVIHLFYYEGYSTAEIAGILGKNETTVRSCLHRGRKKLKEVLREVYDFDETL